MKSVDDTIRIGVSACLLGEEVRYDGGHKRDLLVREVLAWDIEVVPICPEVEAGMGVPREPAQLVSVEGGVRMVGVETGRDYTDEVRRYAEGKARELIATGLAGCILKSGSPSCGVEGVSVFTKAGETSSPGAGLFARALMDGAPSLPIEDENGLRIPERRERFAERVFAYHAALSHRA